MKAVSNSIGFLFVYLLLACGPSPSQKVTPPIGEPLFPNIDFYPKSESVIVHAEGPFGVRTLVVAFQDESVENLTPPEITYNADFSESTVTPGMYSVMGWSTSVDDGFTWVYRGKIRPPASQYVSLLLGDPSLAVSPKTPAHVFYATMASSNDAYNSSALTGNIAKDSLCIARSTDGGLNFPEIACFSVAFDPYTNQEIPPNKNVIDRTAVSVDSNGCVWVSWVDLTEGGLRSKSRMFKFVNIQDGTCNYNSWNPTLIGATEELSITKLAPSVSISPVPQTCKDAHGTDGCCGEDGFVHYCDVGDSDTAVPKKVDCKFRCGWSETSKYYNCMNNPFEPELPEPSGLKPSTCGQGADVRLYSGDVSPRLVNDPSGDVWLGTKRYVADGPITTTSVFKGNFTARHFETTKNQFSQRAVFSPGCKFNSDFTFVLDNFGYLGSSLQRLRVANEYDFGVGLNDNGDRTVLRAAIQVRTMNYKHFLWGMEIDPASGQCEQPSGWIIASGILDDYTTLQPVITVDTDFYPIQGGSKLQSIWYVGFLTTNGSPDLNKNFISHGASFIRKENSNSAWWRIPIRLTPTNSFPCIDNSDYWGDYWGLTTFRSGSFPQLVSAHSMSLQDGSTNCTLQGAKANISSPLHVGVARWPFFIP